MGQHNILIIEDEKQISKALQEKFIREGFTVHVAENGEQGLQMALEQKPDIILLDIVMPRMNGLSMLVKLRADEWGATVPAIILSNLSDAEYTASGLQQGVNDFLVKSDWKLEDIVTKVRERLST